MAFGWDFVYTAENEGIGVIDSPPWGSNSDIDRHACRAMPVMSQPTSLSCHTLNPGLHAGL